jgi:hypothetical protein
MQGKNNEIVNLFRQPIKKKSKPEKGFNEWE